MVGYAGHGKSGEAGVAKVPRLRYSDPFFFSFFLPRCVITFPLPSLPSLPLSFPPSAVPSLCPYIAVAEKLDNVSLNQTQSLFHLAFISLTVTIMKSFAVLGLLASLAFAQQNSSVCWLSPTALLKH